MYSRPFLGTICIRGLAHGRQGNLIVHGVQTECTSVVLITCEQAMEIVKITYS